MNKDITAIILAGGRSSRMGVDKSLLKLDGKVLIEHVVDSLRPYVKSVQVVTNQEEKYSFLKDVSFVQDLVKDEGPFIGMISGLSIIKTDWAFLTSCDMPLIDGRIIDYLWDRRKGLIVSPSTKDGYEPMSSLYSKNILDSAIRLMNDDMRSINRFIAQQDALGLVAKIYKNELHKVFGESVFLNINDQEDYLELLEVFDDR